MLTMEEAMRQTGALPFAAGNIVKGTIIEVRPKEVLVDIGYKSEGVIGANEFDDIKLVKIGDEVDVLVEKLEDKEGSVVLSKEKAEFKRNWEKILNICNEGGTIAGKVKAIVKGGLLVNIGVEAFLPASQIDVTTPKNLLQYVGNKFFAFDDRPKAIVKQGALFLAIETIAFGLNALLFDLLVTWTPAHEILARLVGTNIVYLGFSFPMWSVFVFRRRGR